MKPTRFDFDSNGFSQPHPPSDPVLEVTKSTRSLIKIRLAWIGFVSLGELD